MQIKASEIKEGDILAMKDAPRRVVLAVFSALATEREGRVFVHAIELGSLATEREPVEIACGVAEQWEIEPRVQPPLSFTPAQRHADELADALRDLTGRTMRGENRAECLASAMRAHKLLAEIDPPKPPTLAEAVDLLARAHADGYATPEIGAFLARVPK